jgi:hypothetical protein
VGLTSIIKLLVSFGLILLLTSLAFQRPFDNYTVWGQAVPLTPIHSGNATLDRGLPVFYDCLDEVVDNSFSEQEDSYFQDEPRKSEVIECYYQVFVNSNPDDLPDNDSSDFNNDIEESETDDEEGEGDKNEDEDTLFG